MSIGEDAGPVHPEPTRRSRHRYPFSAKHHGRGPADAARWLPDLGHEEEFAIFDEADFHDLSDGDGNLFGLRVAPGPTPLALGIWGEHVAEFPRTRGGQPWHGYPVWPLNADGPPNRRGQKLRPEKAVFLKTEAAGLLTARDRKRLQKGQHA